jgi:hypothetical protein
MATPLQVPSQYEGGLARIRDLSTDAAQESVRELLEALWEVPNTYNEHSLALAVAAGVDTLAARDVEEMVPALFSLYSYRDYRQAAISDVVEGIAQAMQESRSERLKLSPEDRPDFEGLLARLLDIEPLKVRARARALVFENEHMLRETRVLSDVRSVFDPENPEKKPAGAVILHTLKIGYWADNSPKEFFVALDTEDLRELMEQLERANAKTESLKELLDTSDVPHLDAK